MESVRQRGRDRAVRGSNGSRFADATGLVERPQPYRSGILRPNRWEIVVP
jgi:hypothetical protein